MKNKFPWLLAGTLLAGLAGNALSQSPAAPDAAPQNVVQLSATGSVDVQQDLLVLTLSTTRDGKDASAVQAQLREALEKAVLEARRASSSTGTGA